MKAFILAGEPSGDKLGGALMYAMQELTDVQFAGVGGPMMQQAGLASLFDIDDLSVMGVLEVVPRISMLLGRLRQTVLAADAFEPDVLITIDSPDFCLRVARKLKALRPNLNVVHYVAPSVWAWRPGRAAKMARYVDHMLALLPFEPPLMSAAGMSCDFVGHPLAAEPMPTKAEQKSLSEELGLDSSRATLCLLPGSRRAEVARMGPVFRDVVREVDRRGDGVQFLLPAAFAVVEQVKEMTQGWPVRLHILEPRAGLPELSEHRKRTAFHLSTAAFATSGTVALELAAAGCPMVVGYRANFLTTGLVKWMAQIDTANLINIVTQTRVIPEFLFEECRAENVAPVLSDLVRNPALGALQQGACAQTMAALGLGGEDPGLRAAKSVLGFLDRL